MIRDQRQAAHENQKDRLKRQRPLWSVAAHRHEHCVVRSNDDSTTTPGNEVVITGIDGAGESPVNGAISAAPPAPWPLMPISCATSGVAKNTCYLALERPKRLAISCSRLS
jgi:hypothetical protein